MSAAPKLGRAALTQISTYRGESSNCAIDLSDNTNRFGTAPSLEAVFSSLRLEDLSRYPGQSDLSLRTAIGNYLSVSPDWVITGCGSDDLLDCTFRALGESGDRLVYSEPTFSMVPIYAQANGLLATDVPLLPDFAVDVNGILKAKGGISYLCAPNNPTGTVISEQSLLQILDGAEGVVVLDEAYGEFADQSFVSKVHSFPKFLVTRTFSKAFGLAGLRIGYAVGHPDLLSLIEKVRGPYKVNALAERSALSVLQSDFSWMRQSVELARANRARFENELKQLRYRVVPSSANFVLLPVRSSAAARSALQAKGIAVRAFHKLPGVGDALRISVGPWDQMQAVLSVLKEEDFQ